MKLFYSPQFVGSSYAFDTTRKSRWIAESLAERPIAGINLVEPESLNGDVVAKSHDMRYVLAVETGEPRHLAESQGFSWDPALWPMVLASNGGAVSAALTALQEGSAGSLSSGLHHARRQRGGAFCTFNGLVIAAREILTTGAQSVLILDLDAHCGGGTRSMIEEEHRIWQIDVAVNSFDGYESANRAWLQIVDNADDYIPTIERSLMAAERWGQRFDLCLYNAGMDPYERCGIGGLPGITRDILSRRERLVFDWCRAQSLPVAFVLAGGYVGANLSRDELIDLHRLTLLSAVGEPVS